MAGEPGGLELRVLGPVEAWRDGVAVAVGGKRQRALLALLLAARGKPVPVDRLIDELWRSDPPSGASGTLQSYISRLRATLGEGAMIVGTAATYRIEVESERVDALRFEALVSEGRAAAERRAHGRARERFEAGLALWRGSAFGDVGDDGALRDQRAELEELRLRAIEGRIAAELELGAGTDLVGELERLVDENPYRETLWHHLMVALYRSGRQKDALDAYGRARQLLTSDLGLEPSAELSFLQKAILRHEVSAPPERRRNLPIPPSAFVGRRRELAALEQAVRDSRVVTLTGVGGVGKTRLALEAARRTMPDFSETIFVDLSSVNEPAGVGRRVATVLDVQERTNIPLEEQIIERVGHLSLLLVLDNCEHVREACSDLLVDLLQRCSALHVLATSREFLGCDGEREWPVAPLDSGDAVELFLSRARSVRPQLSNSEEARKTAGAICSDLDGLPLAIELAAARARALSLDDIARGLGDRFRFLVSWRRVAPARHRTLRAAMDWSYELLGAGEQALVAQLSVFAGGFTLAAIADVCSDGEGDAHEKLERLVAASLVVPDETAVGMRYHQLETVRQYAAEHLRDEALADRHAAYYRSLAEERALAVITDGVMVPIRNLDPDEANLRAALRHFERTGATENALRLTASLWRWWWLRGELTEGRERLAATLAEVNDAPPAVRVEALRGASTLALRQADIEAAVALASEAVACAEASADSLLIARAQMALANALGEGTDLDRTERLYRDSADRFRDVSTWEFANTLLNLSDLALNRGDFDAAANAATESLALIRHTDDGAGIAVNLGNLAFATLAKGDADRAGDYLREGLEWSRRLGFREWTAIMLVGLAASEAAGGNAERSAMLLGVSARMQDDIGVTLGSIEGRIQAHTRETVAKTLGDRFEEIFAEGRASASDDAIAAALSANP